MTIQVALSDLKVNVGHWVDMAVEEDVFITRYGKAVAKIVRLDKVPWYMRHIPEEITSVEQLFGTLPSDLDDDEIRLERLTA